MRRSRCSSTTPATLRQAEREAKALYLAPVVSRLEPYLKMLLPGTGLVLDEN